MLDSVLGVGIVLEDVEQPTAPEPDPSAPEPERLHTQGPRSFAEFDSNRRNWFIGCGAVAGFFILLLILAAICVPAEVDDTEPPALTAKPEPTTIPLPVCERYTEGVYLGEIKHLYQGKFSVGSARVEEKLPALAQNPLVVLDSRWRDDMSDAWGPDGGSRRGFLGVGSSRIPD